MIYAFITENCRDLPAAACCRVMGVSTSELFGWRHRPAHPAPCTVADAELAELIREIWVPFRGTYGSPRVWAELRSCSEDPGLGVADSERRWDDGHRRGVCGAVRWAPRLDRTDDRRHLAVAWYTWGLWRETKAARQPRLVATIDLPTQTR